MMALDTETTGVDFYHGSRPFLVTVCRDGQSPEFWEWDVNPETREIQVPQSDVREIAEAIRSTDVLVLQNPKFDYTALEVTDQKMVSGWNWAKVKDTLVAGHLLASSQPHDLTSMALHYLGVDIERFEKVLKKATDEARRLVRRQFPTWRIAKKDLPDMPSARDKTWKVDTWLPRAVATQMKYPANHPWYTVLSEYACADSLVTVRLIKEQERLIEGRGLTKIYRERLKMLSVAQRMEKVGVTVNGSRLGDMVKKFEAESERMSRRCVSIARSMHHDLKMPRSGNNRSLTTFVFGHLGVRPTKRSEKTGEPSLDKDVLAGLVEDLPGRGKAATFLRSLNDKRRMDTAVSYMSGYRRFWVPLRDSSGRVVPNWWVLHPFLNPTGTNTLRWSSSNPNSQNISKKDNFNLRRCFGPAPGREWWSLDAKNIELRLPAYESGEEDFIALFERPDDPPYYGSNHLLMSGVLFPREFAACRGEDGAVDGRIFKKKYASTLYDKVKRFNFAVQYGCQEAKGDLTTGIPGSYRRVKDRFAKQAALNQRWIKFAEKHGYVETIPDRTVDPNRGYPILCTRTDWGKILPTVPLNYHIQGTAMWWMMKAMIRCQATLDKWREKDGFDGHLVMQVHDELVFDFPKSRVDPKIENDRLHNNPKGLRRPDCNLWRIRVIQGLMEEGGRDIGIPTPTSCEYHTDSWAEGVSL